MYYNLARDYLNQLEYTECLVKQVNSDTCVGELDSVNAVLPAVEGIVSEVSGPDLVGCSSTTRHCNHSYCRFYQGMKMLKLHSKMKDLYLKTNYWYFPFVVLYTPTNVFSIPVAFVSIYYLSEASQTISFYGMSIFYNFWILLSFLPILINEWNNYRRGFLATKSSRKLFVKSDLRITKTLSRLSLSIGDPYPDSVWTIFSLDYSYSLSVLDLTMLLCTTFVVPQK
ncbi:hypothetical protein J6590_084134 [Homalodisca vitripennis]|nr:hypothetical protein J6590_084134 [Homalodisca vitripennis]